MTSCSAGTKCESQYVLHASFGTSRFYVYGPEWSKDYCTKTIAFGVSPKDKIPVVDVAFDSESLYALPEITFDYRNVRSDKKAPESVPSGLARDYWEAYAILTDSPRASALLARRILEEVLNAHGHDKGNLNQKLGSLDKSKELSKVDMEKLHTVRGLGNISAHPDKSGTLLEVGTREAELCLEIVDELFRHYYVTPAEVERINRGMEELHTNNPISSQP